MKTTEYFDNYNTIKYFCEVANEGFVIAEINDFITKKEFIADMNKDFSTMVVKLEELKHVNKSSIKGKVLIIDEVGGENSTGTVINLNYNRNWLISLYCNIVIILSSSTVDELISYSSSFWSCVSVHKIFNYKFRNIIEPHFIWSNSNPSKVFKKSKNDPYNTISFSELISKTFNVSQTIKNKSEFKAFLKQKLKENYLKGKKSLNKYCVNLIAFADKLYGLDMFEEAFVCYDFVERNFNIGCDFSEFKIQVLRSLAELSYSKKNYKLSFGYYKRMYKDILVDCDDALDEQQMAIFYNNIALTCLKLGAYEEALIALSEGIECVNYSENTFVLNEILFNISLVSYEIEEYKNSMYYLDVALKNLEKDNSKDGKIDFEIFKILKAYFMVNRGQLLAAKDVISNSLYVLRNYLEENSLHVMEAHYVYSLVYLYLDELNSAEHCGESAFKIMKNIKCDLWIRTQIRELVGKIKFYLCKYDEAKKFLSPAYSYAMKNDLFSDSLTDWMMQAIEKCDKENSTNN